MGNREANLILVAFSGGFVECHSSYIPATGTPFTWHLSWANLNPQAICGRKNVVYYRDDVYRHTIEDLRKSSGSDGLGLEVWPGGWCVSCLRIAGLKKPSTP